MSSHDSFEVEKQQIWITVNIYIYIYIYIYIDESKYGSKSDSRI